MLLLQAQWTPSLLLVSFFSLSYCARTSPFSSPSPGPLRFRSLSNHADHDDAVWTHVLSLRNNTYATDGRPYHSLPLHIHSVGRLGPTTVINVDPSIVIDQDFISRSLERFRAVDDVFANDFTQTVIFQSATTEHVCGASASAYLQSQVPLGSRAYKSAQPALLKNLLRWKQIRTEDICGRSRAGLSVDSTRLTLTPDAEDLLRRLGTVSVHFLESGHSEIPEGPYFASPKGLHRVYRLFADTLGAFLLPTIQDFHDPTTYVPLRAASPHAHNALTIAVPSRLYYTPTPDQPLAGLRITVKDNIDLKGIKTTGGSRARRDLYPPATTSAPEVQRLTSLGAIVIGKSSMAQFAEMEEPTDDYVDFHAPFNPRGDGYRTPDGSSSGGAAGVAGYPWIDVAVGTDSGGSCRSPAIMNGVFGIIASRAAVTADGIIPLVPRLDAIGLMLRDLDLAEYVLESWLTAPYPDHRIERTVPRDRKHKIDRVRVLMDRFKDDDNPATRRLYEEAYTSFAKANNLSLELFHIHDAWDAYKVEQGITDKSYVDYFNNIFIDRINHGMHHSTQKQFRKDYKKAFDKDPYVNPLARLRWKLGGELPDEQYKQALLRSEQLRTFVRAQVVGDDTILFIPFPFDIPRDHMPRRDIYKLDPFERPDRLLGAAMDNNLPTFAGLPDFTVPIGKSRARSEFTGQDYSFAISASITGPDLSDLQLASMVARFFDYGSMIKRLATGSEVYAWSNDTGYMR